MADAVRSKESPTYYWYRGLSVSVTVTRDRHPLQRCELRVSGRMLRHGLRRACGLLEILVTAGLLGSATVHLVGRPTARCRASFAGGALPWMRSMSFR
jgi:hypothetical protein